MRKLLCLLCLFLLFALPAEARPQSASTCIVSSSDLNYKCPPAKIELVVPECRHGWVPLYDPATFGFVCTKIQNDSHKKRILLKLAVAVAGAAVHAAGLHHCRVGGVERCDGKYGASWAIFGVATGLSFAMIPVSENLPVKEGYAFAAAGPMAQLGHGIYEWRVRPEDIRH